MICRNAYRFAAARALISAALSGTTRKSGIAMMLTTLFTFNVDAINGVFLVSYTGTHLIV
jgi:hypothetical protein